MSNVLVLKLSTGEEIIGDIANENEKEFQVNFALLLQYQMQDEGKLGFGFLPYAPLTNKDKLVFKNQVVWLAPPAEGLLNAYKQATGIVMTPSNKLLIPGASKGGLITG